MITDSDTIQFGIARQCITPQVPVSLCGYLTLRMWERVRDHLFVSVLILSDGQAVAAIVLFDWAVMPAPVVERLRQQIGALPMLGPSNILCTCTHTHTSPETRADEPGYSEAYTAWAIERTAVAVRDAYSRLRPGQLRAGLARVAGVAFNRRYWMRTGRVVTNPPRGDARIVQAEGTIDPEIPLVAIEHEGRTAVLLASIVNHTDTLGTSEVSSDWPGVLRQRLETELGAGAFVMPLIGTSGNVNHVDAMRNGEIYAPDNPQRIGEAYVAGISSVLEQLVPVSARPFGVVRRIFAVAPREVDPAELARARTDSQKYSRQHAGQLTSADLAVGAPAALKYFADALLKVAADRREKQYEVIAIRLGELAIISMPGEPFVEVGLRIRSELFPGRRVLLVSHGNAAANYFPMPANFANGGYETTPLCSPHGTDSALRLLVAVRQAAADLGLPAEVEHV